LTCGQYASTFAARAALPAASSEVLELKVSIPIALSAILVPTCTLQPVADGLKTNGTSQLKVHDRATPPPAVRQSVR
jgi:hypothetical protein